MCPGAPPAPTASVSQGTTGFVPLPPPNQGPDLIIEVSPSVHLFPLESVLEVISVIHAPGIKSFSPLFRQGR